MGFQSFLKKIFGRQSADNPSTKKQTSILVVDDEEILLRTVKSILESAGYHVLTAKTGEEGLEMAQEKMPDLILLDIILPGIKGREVCLKIKENEKTKSIPVIFLTSKNSPDDILAEIDAGAEMHLTKPVNPNTLIPTIEEVLSTYLDEPQA